MNLSLNNFADQFVFWNLKKISYGSLELIDSKGLKHFFGNKESPLKFNWFEIGFQPLWEIVQVSKDKVQPHECYLS